MRLQRRKASEGVGGNKLFIRLTVKVLDSEPTHCFRAALMVLTNILLENYESWVQSMNLHCDPPTDHVLTDGRGALHSIAMTLQ